MDAPMQADRIIASIAAAIGEPARARMLSSLLDGHARTSTELAVIGQITASTASAHLQRLRDENLVAVTAQGKHRYYSLSGRQVAKVLESLNVLAGKRAGFIPSTPPRLRASRCCYDHMAGTLAVALNDRLHANGWFVRHGDAYELAPDGESGFVSLGLDLTALRSSRRRFAYACMDWSERRPHLAGALGAALLALLLRRRWVAKDPDSRALTVTPSGRRELLARFNLSDF